MRLFIYEYVTGGGLWSSGSNAPPSGSLLREGQAMLQAVVEDLARIPGSELHVLRDVRLAADERLHATTYSVASAAEEREQVENLSRRSDAVLLIAPEMGDALRERAVWVERTGCPLLSPDSRFIACTADKHSLAEHLRAAGVAVPRGIALSRGEALPRNFAYPAVLKPVDGAGSCEVRRITSADDQVDRTACERWRLEEFCEGASASIAVLTGPDLQVCLPALWQRLGGRSGFEYLGGAGPLAAPLQQRAEALARSALNALPPTRGYVGIDMILGDDPRGRRDVLIEINPRLTTSYVGLRALCRQNLAQAMWAILGGRRCDLSFHSGWLEFNSSGTINTSV